MSLPFVHTRLPRALLGAILLSLGVSASVLTAPLALAASTYPVGASRPLIGAHRAALPAKLAHQAKSSRPAHAPKKKARKPALRGNPARALRAFQAMQRYYYIRGSGLYSGEPFSYLWPFSQALAATVSMANIHGMTGSFKQEI